MRLKNKNRFWLGAGIFGLEILGVGIYGLSHLDYSWATIQLAKIVSFSLIVLLINLMAFWLVKDGSEIKEKEKSKK